MRGGAPIDLQWVDTEITTNGVFDFNPPPGGYRFRVWAWSAGVFAATAADTFEFDIGYQLGGFFTVGFIGFSTTERHGYQAFPGGIIWPSDQEIRMHARSGAAGKLTKLIAYYTIEEP